MEFLIVGIAVLALLYFFFRPGNAEPRTESDFTIAAAKVFTVRIAGISHSNRNGSDRAEIIRRCHKGESLDLVAEPDNPVDENAIAVYRMNGEQLGYLTEGWARNIAVRGERCTDFSARFDSRMGGTKMKPNLGALIELRKISR